MVLFELSFECLIELFDVVIEPSVIPLELLNDEGEPLLLPLLLLPLPLQLPLLDPPLLLLGPPVIIGFLPLGPFLVPFGVPLSPFGLPFRVQFLLVFDGGLLDESELVLDVADLGVSQLEAGGELF